MQMRMWHFKPDYRNAATVSRKRFFNGMRNGLGEHQHFGKIVIRQIKKFIFFYFRNDEHMPFTQWKNIEEGKKVFVLCNFVRRDFAFDYFREDGHRELPVYSCQFAVAQAINLFALQLQTGTDFTP